MKERLDTGGRTFLRFAAALLLAAGNWLSISLLMKADLSNSHAAVAVAVAYFAIQVLYLNKFGSAKRSKHWIARAVFRANTALTAPLILWLVLFVTIETNMLIVLMILSLFGVLALLPLISILATIYSVGVTVTLAEDPARIDRNRISSKGAVASVVAGLFVGVVYLAGTLRPDLMFRLVGFDLACRTSTYFFNETMCRQRLAAATENPELCRPNLQYEESRNLSLNDCVARLAFEPKSALTCNRIAASPDYSTHAKNCSANLQRLSQ